MNKCTMTVIAAALVGCAEPRAVETKAAARALRQDVDVLDFSYSLEQRDGGWFLVVDPVLGRGLPSLAGPRHWPDGPDFFGGEPEDLETFAVPLATADGLAPFSVSFRLGASTYFAAGVVDVAEAPPKPAGVLYQDQARAKAFASQPDVDGTSGFDKEDHLILGPGKGDPVLLLDADLELNLTKPNQRGELVEHLWVWRWTGNVESDNPSAKEPKDFKQKDAFIDVAFSYDPRNTKKLWASGSTQTLANLNAAQLKRAQERRLNAQVKSGKLAWVYIVVKMKDASKRYYVWVSDDDRASGGKDYKGMKIPPPPYRANRRDPAFYQVKGYDAGPQ